MLRGAIDYATPSRLGGWVFCEAVSLRDQTVLAYLGDVCVGTGQIDKFRQDLADVGLSDGFLGFNFAIALDRPADLARVVIRLDGSDAVILQPQGRVAAAAALEDPLVTPTLPPTHRLASVKWMREHGWLDQSEYDFLNCIQQFGVYDRMLHHPRRDGGDPALATDAVTAARELLELYYMDAIELQRETLPSITDLVAFLNRGDRMNRPDPVVALAASERSRIAVVEGSHHDRPLRIASTGEESEAPIDYVLGADRLLFVNARCLFQAAGPAPLGVLELFHAG
jgi:hypothetical protein